MPKYQAASGETTAAVSSSSSPQRKYAGAHTTAHINTHIEIVIEMYKKREAYKVLRIRIIMLGIRVRIPIRINITIDVFQLNRYQEMPE